MLLLSRVKEMKDVNFVLEKQKKSIGISVISEGKKKKEKRRSPSSPPALCNTTLPWSTAEPCQNVSTVHRNCIEITNHITCCKGGEHGACEGGVRKCNSVKDRKR